MKGRGDLDTIALNLFFDATAKLATPSKTSKSTRTESLPYECRSRRAQTINSRRVWSETIYGIKGGRFGKFCSYSPSMQQKGSIELLTKYWCRSGGWLA
jgi:hypothetical protein